MTVYRRSLWGGLGTAMLLLLTACGPGPEFQAVPVDGASRTGTFPKFGHMPQAATEQFTPEERDTLERQLNATGRQARTSYQSNTQSAPVATSRAEAMREIEQTLQQIEASSGPTANPAQNTNPAQGTNSGQDMGTTSNTGTAPNAGAGAAQ